MAHDKGPLYRRLFAVCKKIFAVCFWHTANSQSHYLSLAGGKQPSRDTVGMSFRRHLSANMFALSTFRTLSPRAPGQHGRGKERERGEMLPSHREESPLACETSKGTSRADDSMR